MPAKRMATSSCGGSSPVPSVWTRPCSHAQRPTRPPQSCSGAGDEPSGQPCGAAVAWALEVQTPAVSVEKLRGLEAHYGITSTGGGEYFDVHSSLDLVHAAEMDEVIATLGTDQHPAAQRTVDAITDGLWDLLTSVERTS